MILARATTTEGDVATVVVGVVVVPPPLELLDEPEDWPPIVIEALTAVLEPTRLVACTENATVDPGLSPDSVQ
tara:strand:+ start:51 stop:269 length:219 start_codon:yes stop_codon:yes gene_type:complete